VLAQLSDDQSIRILTVHKSKGLEFDTVVLLGVEDQAYLGQGSPRGSAYVFRRCVKGRKTVTTAKHRDNLLNPSTWRPQRNPHEEFLDYVYRWKNRPKQDEE